MWMVVCGQISAAFMSSWLDEETQTVNSGKQVLNVALDKSFLLEGNGK